MFKKIFCIVFFAAFFSEAKDIKPFVYGSLEPIYSLSPFSATGLTEWKVHQLIFDFLLIEKPGSRDEFLPGLAKNWSVSKNKKVYTFELREATWADGKPITSKDVQFSYEHLFDLAYKSPWRDSFIGIEKFKILSPRKFEFSVKSPQFELWKNISVSLRILPQHFYNNSNISVYNKSIMGSGPYKLLKFESGDKVTLVKNNNWWGYRDSTLADWFSLEQIEFLHIPSESTVAAYFEKNQIDAFPINNSGFVKNFLAFSPKRLHLIIDDQNKSSNWVQQIFFNLKSPLFKNKQFRLALNKLIDRDLLCSKIGLKKPPQAQFSVEEGQKILKDLGWKDKNTDGVLENLTGSLKFEVNYNSATEELILSTLAESMKKYGINIELKFIEANHFWALLRDKKFQAYLDRQDQNQIVLSSVWKSNGAYNNTSFANKNIDLKIQSLETAFDGKDRSVINTNLHALIDGEVPSLILCEDEHKDFVIHARQHLKDQMRGKPFWAWFKQND